MTVERYHELFDVDYLAGTLRRRVSTSNRVKVGDRTGTVNGRGYRIVCVDGKRLCEHRIIVSMIDGRLLDDDDEHVDHVNGVRDDNRIENLRIVDRSGNNRNHPCHRAGKPVGVSAIGKRWKVDIRLDGKTRHILRHIDRSVAARAFEIVDTMLKSGHTFDDAKAAARRECLPE